MLTSENWIAIAGTAATAVIAAVGGIWAVLRWRRESPFHSMRRKLYEQLFEQVCLGTVPRLTSFDWRVLERDVIARTEARQLAVRNSEEHDLRYAAGASADEKRRANIEWVRNRCVEGEAFISAKRLYISKGHRDAFREYLKLAYLYAQSPSDKGLNDLITSRHRLEKLVSSVLKP